MCLYIERYNGMDGKTMEKHLLKKILSAGLALVMAAGLCVCGRKGDGAREHANAALAKEAVYKVNPVDLSGISDLGDSENSWFSVEGIAYSEGGIHAVLKILNGHDNTKKYYVLMVDGLDKNSADVQTYALERPEEVPERPDYNHFAVAADGTIFAVCDYACSGGDAVIGENAVAGGGIAAGEALEERSLVCCWNTDGSLRWKSELKELGDREKSGEMLYVTESWAAADGSLNLLASGDNAYKLRVGPEGTVSEMVKLSDKTAEVLANCRELLSAGDGSLIVMYSDENDRTVGWMAEYDPETDTIGEPGQLLKNFFWSGYDTILAGLDSDLVYADVSGVYRYDRGDAQGQPMMNYINSDRNITSLFAMAELDEKRFFAIYCEDYEDELKAGVFEYVSPEDIEDKDVLVLAGTYIDEEMRKRVAEYNRTNDKYRIVLKEYSGNHFSEGWLTLNNEIAAGNMPDILLTSGMPVDDYIRHGLIADIWPLIRGDEELSKTEFMTNVFDAYSKDGKLYYVVPSFVVVTMATKTSLVGDGSDWSMAKMRQVLDGMGGEAWPIGEPLTRNDFIDKAMSFCGGIFIDVETGKCAFDTEEFISMIEFANTLPEKIDRAELAQSGYFQTSDTQYLNNRALLMELWIDSFSSDLSYQLNGYLGGEFTLVGFPAVIIPENMPGEVDGGSTDSMGSADSLETIVFGENTGSGQAIRNRGGAYITSENQMVLSAGCENLEGAWEFVRYYLTDEYQKNTQYGLPVNKRILMEQAKRTMERPWRIDENGEKVEYDYTISFNGEQMVVRPLSQEQLDQLIAHIVSIRNVCYNDPEVMGIINEELGSFFSGQKSAKEAAVFIQNRVQLYVQVNQ